MLEIWEPLCYNYSMYLFIALHGHTRSKEWCVVMLKTAAFSLLPQTTTKIKPGTRLIRNLSTEWNRLIIIQSVPYAYYKRNSKKPQI